MSVVIVTPERLTDKTVKPSEDGLRFTGGSIDEVYEWAKITNLFCWSQLGVLAVIDEDGKVSLGNLLGNFKKEIEKLWQQWEEKIPVKEEINCFVYPQWCHHKEMKGFTKNIIYGIGAGILFSILYFWVLIDESWNIEKMGYFLFIGGALLILYCFWVGLHSTYKRFSKKYDEIHIFDDEIEIIFDDGSTRLFNFKDIKKYRLKNAIFIGKVVFKDGTILMDTERVSYFPVFRRRLLDKLETIYKR